VFSNLNDSVILHELQGNLCSSTWSMFSPSLFPDLGVCRVVSLVFVSSLSQLLHSLFLPFLKYVTTELPPALLMGSALGGSRSVLELAVRSGGSF